MTRNEALRALAGDEVDAWEDALLELDGHHDRKTNEAVLRVLQRADPDTWWDFDDAAFLAMAHLGGAPPPAAVAPALRWALETTGAAQSVACELLANAEAHAAVPAIKRRLSRGGPRQRDDAADAALGALLSRLEGPQAEPFLLTLLGSRDSGRRLAALAGLRGLEQVTSLAAVRPLATSGGEQSSAVLTLLAHHDAGSWALVDALDDDDRELLLLRARLLARPDLSDELLERWALPSWTNTRAHVLGYLLAREHPKGKSLAKTLASSAAEPPWVRLQSAALMVEFGGGRTALERLLALLRALDDEDVPAGEPVDQTLSPLFSAVSDALDDDALVERWLEGLDALAAGDSEVADAARNYRRRTS